MTSLNLRFIFDLALKRWLTGKESEEDENTKI